MRVMALFQLHFLQNTCVGEDGPGRGHLCHTDTFLVFALKLHHNLSWRFYLTPLNCQSQHLSSALSSACDFKSHFCKQCGPRSYCSSRSSLIRVHIVCLYAKIGFAKFARLFSRWHKQMTFSDAGFLAFWGLIFWNFQNLIRYSKWLLSLTFWMLVWFWSNLQQVAWCVLSFILDALLASIAFPFTCAINFQWSAMDYHHHHHHHHHIFY